MDAWMAFVSIIAIVAIVLVGGGLIALIGHMIIGALDKDKKADKSNEVINYADFKQLEAPKTEEQQKVVKDEYDFEAINQAKAEQERKLLEAEKDIDTFKLEALEINEDEDLDALEARLKAENETKSEVAVQEVENKTEEDIDDEDIESLLDEISNDIIEEEKETAQTENVVKMDSELENYSIDDYLNHAEEIEEPASEEVEEPETQENTEEDIWDEDFDDEEDSEDDGDEVEVDLTEEVKDTKEEQPSDEDKTKEIAALKLQLAELNQKLEEARAGKVEVVSINMTEEECVNRLEILEERLRNVKKDYKINMKEFKPLKKVMNDLDKFQTKLRRKETIVAKKKVALYGVNNYVDIDKEKAEKLANELELLEGLRLSVQHCEEVINSNKDRFPILEHTNKILEDQISHLEADIEATNQILNKIREENNK